MFGYMKSLLFCYNSPLSPVTLSAGQAMDVSIIGYGVVGKAVYCGFKPKCRMHIFDPASPSPDETERADSLEDAWKASPFVFVCVPTPCDAQGRFDATIIDETIAGIAKIAETAASGPDGEKILIIKSTVIPTKVRQYLDERPELNIVVMPEYLVEAKPSEQFLEQPFRIIGGHPDHTAKVAELFEKHSACAPAEIGFCDAVGASLIKYMTNTFLAMKVSFMNQINELYERLDAGTSWDDLMRCLHLDERIGTGHYHVPGPDGRRGWGGKCFPKDLRALVTLAGQLGCDLSLLKLADDYNSKIRPEK